MTKYKQNLHVSNDKVYSYDTHVATISGRKLLVHGYWSMTTSKHINYVAKEYGLTKEDAPVNEVKEENSSMFRSTGIVAMMGEIFGNTKEGKNDWKLRMLKAGLPALDVPEDWNTLTEEEKEKRLNGVIELATKD